MIKWSAPTTGLAPVNYLIYRDAALTDLAGAVTASGPLKFTDHNRSNNISYSYYIVSQAGDGSLSTPSVIVAAQ